VKLDYQHNKAEWAAAARAIRGTIAGATRAAFQDLAAQVQRQGRAEIARSGLSRRWQTGFRTYVFPRRIVPGSTAELAMRGQHRIGYANVFERGGRIGGRPLLWIPLPSAPKKINGRPTTAGAFVRSVGPLHSINRPGRPPLLAGYAMRAPSGGSPVSVAALRTGQRNTRRRQARAAFGGRLGKRPVSVPLFVGLPAVKIRDRLNISAVYERGRRELPALYAKRLAELNR
jgi:hypothetical protein